MSDSNNTIKWPVRIIDQVTGEIVATAHRGTPPAGDEDGETVRRCASGLSTYHISTKDDEKSKGQVIIYPQGSLLKVSKNRVNPFEGQSRDWVRGKIKGFSRASRRRLMRSLAKVNKGEKPQFVTLTYPSEWPDDPKEWKKQIERFNKRMKYRFPKYAAFWKLEFQKRGAPHFHMLVWGLPKQSMKDFIALHWYEVVGSGDEKHLRAGTQIQRIRSWRGVMAYASKYLGKSQEDNNDQPVGRFWGIYNRSCVPWSDEVIYLVTQSQIIMAMRYMRRYANIPSRDYSSLTIYINSPPEWERAILG